MGELTVPKVAGYDPAVHISVSCRLSKPSLIELVLKCSKTDQLGRGARIYIGRTDTELCPVAGLIAYLAVRGMDSGPLFRLEDSIPLLKTFLMNRVWEALLTLGYDQSLYAGHSFRIGTATTAAAVGIEDSVIQALAFQTYIRPPQHHLASLSRQMAAVQHQ